MKQITQQELNEVIKKHKNWLNDEKGGERAELSFTDLRFLNFSNADLRCCEFINCDFSNAFLSHANLSHADLSESNFENAFLSECNLSHADLRHSNFTNAFLFNADLSHADLSYCDFKNCNLKFANFKNAILHKADFTNAILRYTNLSHADLASTLIPIYCHHFVAHTHDFKEVTIGCKRKTIEEWDCFFNESDEEYATKRGTEEFKRIQANYLAMKAYIEFMQK